MRSILLRGNSPVFASDLTQMGHVFFPGEAFSVWVPGEDGAAPQAAPPDGWRVDVVALPSGGGEGGPPWQGGSEGALPWHVAVEVSGPAGRRRAEGGLTQTADESPRTFEHRLRRLAKGLLVDVLSPLVGFRPGWGILTGVRPTKLVHQMLDAGEPDPVARLTGEYRLAPEKAELVTGVARLQRPYLGRDPRAVSLYIGIPFCPSICSFCSFSIYPINQHRSQVSPFLEALGREMAIIGEAIRDLGLRVESIYFGGGTPTSPRDEDFAWMLQAAEQHLLRGQAPAEYTMEGGRPETFNKAKLDAMAAAGVNRVSVNPQTTVQATLMHLGRIHTVEKFYRAYDLVRSHPAGFTVNTDIIIGLPGEGPAEVHHTLADMRRLAPDNLTVHTLAVKRGSRIHGEGEAGEVLRALTPAEAEALVQDAAETARAMGQRPYYLYRQKFMVGALENVGYALPGKESLYNIQMMEERQTVIGLGAGATSKWYKPLGGNRGWLLKAPANPGDPQTYVERAEELARRKVEHLRLLYGE
ncbi:oxygen-independent coproporphyrinogen-3 oxidase [Symbiobacterium terraclitae]|uniref:Oxygen-independent coproporphyrinogen-3 oxidase n=1 Tax=Symbiobacterium terraclitae TaxID=557451 RepID=A0ABS4JTJ4_9FIRM|nr:coproporphyrinogen dehydrogenase HemZ [Symbiobacterium terraclitae]MBP2018270.1 oxygen-independent coproporphyrinogen-3 oxidase [Symbiobacterium terraclitae]